MTKLKIGILYLGILMLTGCSPVKLANVNQYRLSAYSSKVMARYPSHLTLRVTPPEAVAGYQTQNMLYIKKPYQVESFAKNTWANPPADMLYPLIIQSLQKTQFFHAVTSSYYTQDVNYRLDTQVLALQQNFLKRPSVLEFSAKLMLTNTQSNLLVASKVVHLQIPCTADTPYGGVIAANRAALEFTAIVDEFVVSHVKQG